MIRKQVLYVIPNMIMRQGMQWQPYKDGEHYFDLFKFKTMGNAKRKSLNKFGDFA